MTASLDILEVIVPGLYSEWRVNQLEVIQQVSASDKKFVAIQAPTGFGKSASAIGSMLMEGGRGVVVTQTKQLGEQYFDDYFPIGLKTVKGRPNFPCVLLENKTADEGPCTAGAKCGFKRGGCPYYDQKREATNSPLTSMNIHYFLAEANYVGDFSNVEMLFIDEAHKLDNALMQFIEIRLSKSRFQDEGHPVPHPPTMGALKEWARKILPVLEAELDEITEELDLDPGNDILILRGSRLSAIVNALGRFSLVDETWVIEQDGYAVILKPTIIAKYAEIFLFQHAKRVVLMSGTLPRPVVESYGIVDYEYINLPSNFDPQYRPVIWVPAANLARSAEQPGMELKKLAATVDAISVKFSDVKGLIHTANYRIANHLVSSCASSDRMITHKDAKEREWALETFKSDTSNMILVSPSFTEGIDLPYDACRFQIIAKIPYADLSNKQVKARMESDPQWYATSTIVSMIQAYGRIMRAEDDSGVTYILDSSLMNLINRWRTIFNQISWFLDALLISQGGELVPFKEYSLSRRKAD